MKKVFAKLLTRKNALTAAAVTAVASTAVAGGADVEFQAIYDQMVTWSQGFFGRIIALGMLGTSMFMAFVKTNFIGSLGALAAALILFNADGILQGILAATI
jgi:conjugal transfer pilus assembly protein TraA